MHISLSMVKKKFMTAKEIVDEYKEGRRDFSGIVCNNDSFDNFDLHGIIFRKANLSYCSFYGTNLEGADLSGAILEWTGFIKANLKGANFEKVRAVWSRFNDSQFEKTNMRGADLSWSLFFNTNIYDGTDLTGAITATIATDPSQITEEGVKKLREQLGNMPRNIDPELLIRLELIAKSTKETFGKTKNVSDNVNVNYNENSNAVYKGPSGNNAYSVKGVSASPYNPLDVYSKKKKNDPYDK